MSRRHGASLVTCLALAGLLAGCGPGAREWATVREVTPPFLADSAATDPALAADRHGRVALTWVTCGAEGQDLWLALSSDSGLTFAAPVRVNARPGSVSSSAESRPVVVFGPRGEMVVAWSERRATDSLVADVVARASGDGGRTLGPASAINDDVEDAKPVFHGFPTLTFLEGGAVFAAWVDHRESPRTAVGEVPASLFYALSHDGGQSWSDNRPLTRHACPRCRPTALGGEQGMVAVAYREDRPTGRDAALAVSRDGGVSFAHDAVLVAEGWCPEACPVDGPALAVDGTGGGHYAWYSGAGGGSAWIAPWRSDGGLGGVRRALSDSLSRFGHPRLARLGDATIVALEARTRADSTSGVIAVRALDPDGTLTPWLFLGADASDAWMAAPDDRSALLCWVERGENGARVRLAKVTRGKR